ncbi:MAG: Cell shape-determining protein MreC [Candidatus Uhrbacteria bacterium GW2011_GWD2_52_7]|uniref:Cell shape-determining protein MreC n=1 Tax=Candidatus Uhrbacteria bacterium GW2011_GWD2_52_7 TaxID=1618989 RepID=A0A0G1XC09_9BACT|nr:MAG: Cell shape-determining protein MreC [Candidatus Uhrbacteria bacterium GW2011_GWD2_52_7]
MPRAWYATDRARGVVKGSAMFLAGVLVYTLLIRIQPLGIADAWARHQLVRMGTWTGGVIARLIASEDSFATQFAACEEDRMETTERLAEAQANARELEEIRGLLHFQEKVSPDGVAARVLARSIGGSSSVTIDRGTSDGVTIGMAAVIREGIYYGVVTEVEEYRATVRLSTDRTSKVPAAIVGKQRTIGMVEGQEGALLAMDFIPQDANVEAGNLVVTSGLDGLMPEGLVIGMISDVVVQESAPFKRAIIEPLHDPREWSTMLILSAGATVGL